MKMNNWLAGALALSSLTMLAQEQETVDILNRAPIATDRPDITESAQITPAGWFQYEGGYQFSRSAETYGAETNEDKNQVEQVLRFGINNKLEVRAVINANTLKTSSIGVVGPMRMTGVDPITLGIKYNLLEETTFLPHATWLSHITSPRLAAGDYRAPSQSNLVFHEQRLMLEKSLTDRFGIASNIGVSGGLAGSNGFISDGMFSLAAGYDLGNHYGIYVEYFSEWFWAGNQFYNTPYFDGGFTKLLSNDLQLDVYAGFNLSAYTSANLPTTGIFIGTGISYRLPLARYLK